MNFKSARRTCVAIAFFVATAINSPGQQFTTLAIFDGTDGNYPAAPLVQGLDGNFYGVTGSGGAYGSGTAFKVTPAGVLTTLHTFDFATDGSLSFAGLTLATNGRFYGTNSGGGAHGYGTVFEMTPAGSVTTLYNFCSQANCADGSGPGAGLVQAADGNFYGTTTSGGALNQGGTVFKITPAGKLTTLYTFCAQTNCPDGDQPLAPLVQGSDGNFYSTTYSGGTYGYGTVFTITTAGKLTTLYSFCGQVLCPDGERPYGGGLVQGSDGNFYGTTILGGTDNFGTVFKITKTGKLTTLHSFVNTDGESPYAALIQATDGNFYGLTQIGGANNSGTIFEITSAGTLSTLYNFCSQPSCADGTIGYAALIQSTNGTFYGTTEYGGGSKACRGGPGGCGTVFSLSQGLGPFVETVPTSGKAGATVLILGNNLTGATSVSFNGTTAAFTTVSSTEIKATVPTGATTGTVKVVTPSGTLDSNVPFRVTP
jgi:uncharacterized repeat protein (TIGR03803 family)